LNPCFHDRRFGRRATFRSKRPEFGWIELFNGKNLDAGVLAGMPDREGVRGAIEAGGPPSHCSTRPGEPAISATSNSKWSRCSTRAPFRHLLPHRHQPGSRRRDSRSSSTTRLRRGGYLERTKRSRLRDPTFKTACGGRRLFKIHIAVRGKNCPGRLNDTLLLDYTAPERPNSARIPRGPLLTTARSLCIATTQTLAPVPYHPLAPARGLRDAVGLNEAPVVDDATAGSSPVARVTSPHGADYHVP
jgi:hypothetical protein